MKKWCRHIKWTTFLIRNPDRFVFTNRTGRIFVGDLWKQCPICGTARPRRQTKTDLLCRKVREEANKWTPAYRTEMLAKGMAIINSGKSAKKHYSGVCMTLTTKPKKKGRG